MKYLLVLLALTATLPAAAQPRIVATTDAHRLILDGDRLRLTTPDGAVPLPLDGTFVHARLAHHAALGVLARDGDKLRLTLAHTDGTPRRAFDLPFTYDAPFPEFDVAPDGSVAWIHPGTTELEWRNADGRRVRLDRLAPDVGYAYERAAAVRFAPDGRLAVAYMRDVPHPGSPTANIVVHLFNRDGELVWTRTHAGPWLAELSFDDRPAVTTYDGFAQAAPTRLLLGEDGQVRFREAAVLPPHPLATSTAPLPAPAFRLANANGYPWPVAPFDETHPVTGTFAEYRNTGSAPHFHSGTDVPFPDGGAVYPVVDGTINAILTTGSNAYVRVDSFAYVHIVPNPDLKIGSNVKAGQTLLGTILSGQGHVHFNAGYPPAYGNALLPGGFAPFEDRWAPTIDDVRFAVQPTGQPLDPDRLSGEVEITIRVKEPTGHPSTTSAAQNNGAYRLGYQVLTRDRQTVLYEPSEGGEVYRFDLMPSNEFVHNVFDPRRATLSNHVYFITNEVERPSYLDANALGEGDYTIRLWAEDTKGNLGEAFVDVSVTTDDLVPPPATTFEFARTDGYTPHFAWTPVSAFDLDHYRLYESADPTALDTWKEMDASHVDHTGEVISGPTYYAVAAADTVSPPNVSPPTDVYGTAPTEGGPRILIVDGFDRRASWDAATHNFAAIHGQAIAAAGYGFDTISNEAFVQGRVNFLDYDAIFWLVGDESTSDETFSSAEQQRVKAFLFYGGKLFVSGSEIGWDLGARGSSTDEDFLRDWLKAEYYRDDAGSYTVQGVTGGPFDGLAFSYGEVPYEEDFPDAFRPADGAESVLTYGNGWVAGVAYRGHFKTTSTTSDSVGTVVLMGFPFETVEADAQAALMARVLDYFFAEGTPNEAEAVPSTTALLPMAPHPVTSQGTLQVVLSRPGTMKLSVWDILGRRVAVLREGHVPAGTHAVTWQTDGVAAGTYVVQLEAEGRVWTQRVVVAH